MTNKKKDTPKHKPDAAQIVAALRSQRSAKEIVLTDLQAELATRMHRLLDKAERAAGRGKPALLRLITRYATHPSLRSKTKS